MATLSVTTVTTGNATTDHTINTGNTTAGDIIIYSNGYGIILGGNNSTNTIALSPNGHVVFANATANTLVLNSTANLTLSGTASITTNTLTLGTSSVAANGYSRLPNGLLMQWGNITATVNNTTTNAITFPTSFTTFYSASVTLLNATSVATTNPGVAATITANSATTLTWRTTSTAAAGSATVYWWAIGV